MTWAAMKSYFRRGNKGAKTVRRLSKHLSSDFLHRDTIRKSPRYSVPSTVGEVASV
jgi:hypothetical protein